jgi:2',3'-cyclic-nucleotide 2'-phosphodiesterase
MNILYIGDIMGEPGIKAAQAVLPELKKQHKLDLVIAQAENVSEGKGLTLADYKRLGQLGINFFTGGNHILYRDEIYPALSDPNMPVIRPANYPEDTPGRGYKYADTPAGKVLVISLLGHIVGKDAAKPVENPLQVIDQILESESKTEKVATIVNFHGDYSSEKRVIGYYLDGKVTAVIGDHWHVPTADALVLPKGTAHITDVGMCGTLHSSLGVKSDIIIDRWRDGLANKNELETAGPLQFSAVLVETEKSNGLATSIQSIWKVL